MTYVSKKNNISVITCFGEIALSDTAKSFVSACYKHLTRDGKF